MRFSTRRLITMIVILLTPLAFTAPAGAATFSKASVKGAYGFLISLWTANASTPATGTLGVMTFDGAGHVSAAYSSLSSSSNLIKSGTWGGTYNINSDGSGTINFTAGTITDFAITLNSSSSGVAHGLQLLLTDDSKNEVVSGAATLQSTSVATYGAATVTGSYAFLANTLDAKATQADTGFVGLFTFDGKGKFSDSFTTMAGGTEHTGSMQGTYTVNTGGVGQAYYTECKCLALIFSLNSVTLGQAGGLQFLAPFGSAPSPMVANGVALHR